MTALITNPDTVTPVETHGLFRLKRDDLFGIGCAPGGKVRTCLRLAEAAGGRGVNTLVTASASTSPQAHIVAVVAEHLGMDAHIWTTKADTPEVRAAAEHGARIHVFRPALYTTAMVAKARDHAEALGACLIPYGMESRIVVGDVAAQVSNVPADHTVVVAVGSGMHFAALSVSSLVRVLGVVVGKDPRRHIAKFAPLWRLGDRTLVTSDLGYRTEAGQGTLSHVGVDPHYEAKCLPYLTPGDTLWIVGHRGPHIMDLRTRPPALLSGGGEG